MAATTTTQPGAFETASERPEFSWTERMALRRTHPSSMFIDVVAWTWAIFLLWRHDWQAALASLVAARFIGLFAARNLDIKGMSETTLGKIALLHLHPVNLATQLAGTAILLYGVWTRDTVTIMAGVSAVLLGHVFGWSKVNPKYAMRTR